MSYAKEKPDNLKRVLCMRTLRRYNFRRRDYFVTVVTYRRRPLLTYDPDMFWESWGDARLNACVILPDHFHAILNTGDNTLSAILHRFKIRYSRRYRDAYGPGRVWQNRFWDHMIRDEEDYHRHINYIHYNPVKHGIVGSEFDYAHSSIHDYAEQGYYENDLLSTGEENVEGDFGE